MTGARLAATLMFVGAIFVLAAPVSPGVRFLMLCGLFGGVMWLARD